MGKATTSMHFFYKFFNFYLYSSLHIAIAAVAMVYLTELVLDFKIEIYYYLFVFASTILLYSIHRLVGIKKSKEFENIGRFAIINQYKSHIFTYAVIGLVLALYSFFQLDRSIQIVLLLPGAVSFLYTLPLFKNSRRLRDIHYIKIFLIAIIWSLITVSVPQFIQQQTLGSLFGWLPLERFLFIFAITIPFDVRDYIVDKSSGVKTIPQVFGIQQSLTLAFLVFICCILIQGLLFVQNQVTLIFLTSSIIFYIISIAVVQGSKKTNHDYYYSGLIDGLMILYPVIYLFTHFVMS